MIIISRYSLKNNIPEGIEYVETDEAPVCSICGKDGLKPKGRRRRVLILPEKKIVLKIRRLQCVNCGKIHHELPDIVVPYKRHCAEDIEKIIRDEESGINCEDSTIRRIKAWWMLMCLYIEKVRGSYFEKYKIRLPSARKLAENVRALANRNMWPRTRSALMSG
jgi:hypothetical protein